MSAMTEDIRDRLETRLATMDDVMELATLDPMIARLRAIASNERWPENVMLTQMVVWLAVSNKELTERLVRQAQLAREILE